MYAADVVVCPSRWEGMSLVPLEAMNLGRALVVTDVDGMAEAVPAAAARIVPPEDPAALGQAIAALLADRAALSAAGDAGRAHAVAVNSGPSSADKLVALYTELAGRVPARV
jgi:glycosyltransferase involved in cell wall biosynthesis